MTERPRKSKVKSSSESFQLDPSKRYNTTNQLPSSATTNKHNDYNQHKKYNRAGDVEPPSHKDITSAAQQKGHNVTFVKRWDILQNYVGQKCQNVPDQGHHNDSLNNHTTNPQGKTKQDVYDM